MPVRRPGDVSVNSRRLQVVMTLPSRQIMSETSVRIAKKNCLITSPSSTVPPVLLDNKPVFLMKPYFYCLSHTKNTKQVDNCLTWKKNYAQS